jgi:uncharacterized membrane protein
VDTKHALGVEVGAALGILGLLLVFLPLFVQAAANAAQGKEPQKERRARIRQAWGVPVLIAVAAIDATLGLLSLWDTWGVAGTVGWLLIVLMWLVVVLAAWTVKTGVS